jgi:ferredoxin, 2Fe-2S
MTPVVGVRRDRSELVINGTYGHSLMLASRDGGVEKIMTLCGGGCSCGTCHVYAEDEWCPLVGAAIGGEQTLLNGLEHRRDNTRLSCQIVMRPDLSDLRTTIAPEE